LLTIKREYANWQSIALKRLYQMDTLVKEVERLPVSNNNCSNTKNVEVTFKIYGNKEKMIQDILDNHPLSGIFDCTNNT
jgi:hypothetical protein